jgi:hypothetical protein
MFMPSHHVLLVFEV